MRARPAPFAAPLLTDFQPTKAGYDLRGRNGMARRVEISHAQVSYDEEVPAAERRPKPEEALVVGTEVRVTAEQGSDGEWRASEVEILKVVGSQHATAT